MQMRPDQAEIIALQALGWVLADDELTSVFLGATGADANALRNAAEDPHVLGSVLDFVLMQDQSVLDFAASIGQPPEAIAMARHYLNGGEQVHWT